MNIEQKAREVVENILNFAEKLSGKPLNFRLLINIKTGEHYDGQDRMNGYVADALQSAVAEEREECAKDTCAQCREGKIPATESALGTQRFWHGDLFCQASAIRARGQKETA